MDEKKWTDDERDEAFDRGMETMQRVALELYRRGREPLLEELEEARARNADMRAMLEQVTRDRDHVEESLVRLEAQRDEARAEVERLKAISRDEVRGMTLEQVSDLVVAESLWTRGYRRGAEAMREACARMEPYAYNLDDHLMISKWRSLVRGLPIPEDK